MNRSQLQQLAEERVIDAQALLNASRWSSAYYLAGYSVECALKACIAKLTNQHDFPDKGIAQRSYTHNIEALVGVAGLKQRRDEDVESNPALAANWLIIKDWNERVRYQARSESQARKLFAAITDATDGVLPWIKGHW